MSSVSFTTRVADTYFTVNGELRGDGTLDRLTVATMVRDVARGRRIPAWQLEYDKRVVALPTLAQAHIALRHFANAILQELGEVENVFEA